MINYNGTKSSCFKRYPAVLLNLSQKEKLFSMPVILAFLATLIAGIWSEKKYLLLENKCALTFK